jgi:hypothetical protein
VDKSSCIPKEPFIKLGGGEAPILNYNLPQKTAFSVYGRISAGIPAGWFQDYTTSIPVDNWWDRYAALDEVKIRQEVLGGLSGAFSTTGIIRNVSLFSKPKLTREAKVVRKPAGKPAAMPPAIATRDRDVDAITNGIRDGMMPVATQTFGGSTTVTWIPKPINPIPKIYIVEEYSIASYLGDYGAGKTVGTCSLLPGETTTISLRTYQENSETATQSQNVLDSFTEESADEFETTLQEETGSSTEDTSSNSSGSTGEVALMIDLFGIVEVGGKTEPELSQSTSATRESYVTATSSAMEKHVTKTSSFREVEVNTTSTTTTTSGTDQTITRQLENINKSRVLNFAFRQLQQEYITITYLKSVRFLYTNGYGESVELVEIPQLRAMLEDKIEEEHVREAMAMLLKNYCVVYNHRGEALPFLEKVTQKFGDCEFAGEDETISFWRKRRGLTDTVAGITVPGVILRVDRHILRTPAIVVDGLLAGGECLDCYNQQMQDAAVQASILENRKVETALNTLAEIADPVARAEAYQKMFYPPVAEEAAQTS